MLKLKLRAIPLGLDNIYLPSEEARRRSFEQGNRPPSGDKKWKRGEMEFEAMMRHLDNAVRTSSSHLQVLFVKWFL